MVAVFLQFYLAVEVRQGTLSADGRGLCSGGPAENTGHGGSRLRADSATTRRKEGRKSRLSEMFALFHICSSGNFALSFCIISRAVAFQTLCICECQGILAELAHLCCANCQDLL